jgi:hypothetical protein
MRMTIKTLSVLTGSALLLSAAAVSAQSVVNLTAARQSTTMPDGNTIPMWGWQCGLVASGAAGPTTCTQTDGLPQNGGTIWQPPLIQVPYTSSSTTGVSTTALQIVLTNALPVPTSLTIVGQMPNPAADVNGPGNPTRESGRPAHAPQTATTWTTVVTSQPTFTPPAQGARAQSFVQEAVAASCSTTGGVTTCTPGAPITYTWTNLTPGTYLIESGSYPSIQGPMGLYGVLVVTTAPVTTGTLAPGIAYPGPCGTKGTAACSFGAAGVPYDADGVLLLSEIDAVQNAAADTAVLTPGFSPFTKWSPACSASGSADPAIGTSLANTCYPAAVNYTPTYYLINGRSFDRTQPILSTVTPGATTSAGCTALSCTITQTDTYSTGTVLLRFVNAGLRMHMPSVAGLQMALIAEDGHLQPDVALAFTKGTAPATCSSGNLPVPVNSGSAAVAACPKVQNDWFMPAGKVLDIAVKPGGTAGAYPAAGAYYPVFARDLGLSTNNLRDGGMQGFVMINAGTSTIATTGSTTTQSGYSGTGASLTGFTVSAQANPDNFILPTNSVAPFTFNVLANDIGVTNSTAITGATSCPTQAPGQTNCLYLNGMYTYVPAAVNTALSFTYCGNGATTAPGPTCAVATVSACAATANAAAHQVACLGTAPTHSAAANAYTFHSAVNTLLNVSAPGVLTSDTDPAGYRLYASITSVAAAPNSTGSAPQSPIYGPAAPLNVVEGTPPAVTGGCTITLQSNGSFTAQSPANAAGNTCTFQYYTINAQGTPSAAAQTVTLHFPVPSNLNVQVADGVTGALITDYKWVIEQDLTFKIDPACQINNGATGVIPTGSDGKPCPAGGPNHVPPTLGTNFHTSYMPVIASGCTGVQSCERGQSVYDPASGGHVPAACNHGVCLPSAVGSLPVSLPSQVQLNAFEPDGVSPARYYISILPGDSANPFNTGYAGNVNAACQTLSGSSPTTPTGQQVTACGHTMSGAPIPAPTSCTGAGTARVCTFPNGTGGSGASATNPTPGSPNYPLVIYAQPNPLLTATLTIFVFEDDAPLNGEHDVGGNNNEPGLGGFQVELWDEMAQAGDFTGQMTYDIFNEPLSNSLNGTIDPLTGLDACPVAATANGNTVNPDGTVNTPGAGAPNQVASGMIIICPQYESDGATPSPLVGNAVVKNLMPGRFGVIVHESAAREAAGEVWYQTNTLDGTHFLDSFVKVGEPAYFQEYGPGGWHVAMGMANPAVINARLPAFCNGPPAVSCNNTVQGQVSNLHENRAPDETLFDSGVFPQGDPRNYAAFAHTTCWASLGDPDGLTFAFTNCDANGNFTFTGIPDGNWALTVGDQWNDLIIDGSSKPVNVCTGASCVSPTANPYNIDFPTFSWQTHIWTNAFMDINGNGIQDDPVLEPGLIQTPMRIRFRNGRFNNTLFTDNTGHAHFNETFPLFNWYVIESDNTRFKNTGVHVVYDFGGQIDGPSGTNCLGALALGSSNQANSMSSPCGNGRLGSYQGILNSIEPPAVALPSGLRYPGSHYCANGDCSEINAAAGFPAAGGPGGSTGRIDPGTVVTEGVQGFLSQTEIVDWGKLPYLPGENGGVRGHVVYASTRPFDDPTILFQNLWEPLVPRVVINLYRETAAPDGTTLLTLVDSTTTSSWDDFTQGWRVQPGADGTGGVPNLNCPGQPTTDPFFNYTLYGTPNYLSPNGILPSNSQYKCYDSMHNFNQVQPAPYDGLYQFPSKACSVAGTGSGAGYVAPTFNATVNGLTVTASCGEIPNPNYSATPGPGQYGSMPTILPAGKYIVEMVTPPGYELVKEEDKNILIGDNFIASAAISPQFSGIGDIFIVPDQASINQNNINGLYNPAMYSNLTNADYTGPINGTNPYAACSPGTSCPPAGNNGNPTATMGRDTFAGFGPGGLTTLNTPCAGEVRIVPDFMSISPESGQVAPFAGASRPLCDRKEITLEDQMQAQTEFFIWTKTPAATHYTGFILDDFSSEFDQASPSFGEKFAVPNLPVSIKDFNGVEVERVYSDQWGLYNGLLFSTWEVNPPNPTGYSPGMYITEMNSPGPIYAPVCITAPTSTTQGFPLGCVTNQTSPPTVKITDPFFNPGYSTFDYENPFMPADTTYLDTPVIPVMAFAEAYNPPDCAYPDATPAIKSVTAPQDTLALNGASGPMPAGGVASGPWVSAFGHQLVITAVGDVLVPNYAYSGPAASTVPFNQKMATRHYGFGANRGSGFVTIGGVRQTVNSWTDSAITITTTNGDDTHVPFCLLQQRGFTVGAARARCGELVVQTGSGKRSIDAVMVTIGGKKPTFIASEKLSADTFGTTAANSTGNALQAAIDAAASGDLIIVGPGTYTEMVQMWKPVRLQGVAAASSIINANTQPAGKLDPWRRRLNCLFGLNLSGQQIGNSVNGTNAAYDPNGQYSCPFGATASLASFQAAVDPIQLEPVIGWDSNLNGNISELLQEPTLMGAYEGAAITVLGKGLENFSFGDVGTTCDAEGNGGCITLNNCPVNAATNNATGVVTCTSLAAIAGSTVKPGDCNPSTPFYTSNFQCNPSRIDGFTLTNSSQGGGAVFIHGWNHYLEVSNNKMTGNAGTLTGGITLGQPEVPDPTVGGALCNTLAAAVNPLTGVNEPIIVTATDAAPLCIDTNVNMHNNTITFNSSYGDELNSNTPAAGGGVTVNTGSDRYSFTYNFVCGNLSSGDGGGMTHFGLSFQGDIEHNTFQFNQSTNPTLTTNGGGLIVEGNAPDGTFAENSQIDQDAGPALSDGTGPGIVINANLMIGNTAESGEGGGLRIQTVNGNDVLNNPGDSTHWYGISVTNNIIVDNVAGWEGGGVSIQDAVAVNFENNTVVANDQTSTAGVLFDTLGAQFANTPPPNCNPDTGAGCTNPVTTSVPQTAGLVTHPHSLLLAPAFSVPVAPASCPNAAAAGYSASQNCSQVSLPVLANNIIFNNRPFNMTVAGSPAVVVLTPPLSQPATPAWSAGVVTGGTGACASGANYWDIGVYGDTTISGGNPGGFKLNPTNTMLTSLTGPAGGYSGNGNVAGPSGGAGLFVSMYCNGSRVPPEISPTICTANPSAPPGTGPANAPGCTYSGALGITTPPGVPDNNPFYQNLTLTPAATVDEGNNWVNMFYGPLTTVNPTIPRAAAVGGGNGSPLIYGNPLGNYSPGSGFPANGVVAAAVPHPLTDFFGNPRPAASNFDMGAVQASRFGAAARVLVMPLQPFGNVPLGTAVTQGVTVSNPGLAPLLINSIVIGGPLASANQFTVSNGNCPIGGAGLAAGGTCTADVTFHPTRRGEVDASLVVTVAGQ